MISQGTIAVSMDAYRAAYGGAQSSLHDAIRQCEWRPVKLRSLKTWAFRDSSGDEPYPAARNTSTMICITPHALHNEAMWHISRIGPFVTEGNGTRVEVMAAGIYEAMGLRAGDEIAESEAGPRWAETDAMAHLPELYVHHFVEIPREDHYARYLDRLRTRRVLYELSEEEACDALHFYTSDVDGPAGFTSDWQCSARDGCTGQWVHQIIPEPYAFVFLDEDVPAFRLNFVIEDLRRVAEGSLPEPRRWYVELALLRHQRRTGRAPVVRPTFGMPPYESVNIAGKRSEYFATFAVLHGQPAVNWYTFHWPADVDVLSSRVHSHTSYGGELWIVSGSPQDAGLPSLQASAAFDSSRPGGYVGHSQGCDWRRDGAEHREPPSWMAEAMPLRQLTIDETTNRTAAYLERSGGRLLCRFTFPVAEQPPDRFLPFATMLSVRAHTSRSLSLSLSLSLSPAVLPSCRPALLPYNLHACFCRLLPASLHISLQVDDAYECDRRRLHFRSGDQTTMIAFMPATPATAPARVANAPVYCPHIRP